MMKFFYIYSILYNKSILSYGYKQHMLNRITKKQHPDAKKKEYSSFNNLINRIHDYVSDFNILLYYISKR